jgi:hypothetical protein
MTKLQLFNFLLYLMQIYKYGIMFDIENKITYLLNI